MTKKELKEAKREDIISWVHEGRYSKQEIAALGQQHGIPQILMWVSTIPDPQPVVEAPKAAPQKPVFPEDPPEVDINPPQRTIVKKVNPQGRPSDKRKRVKYGRLSARIDERVIKKMKHCLIDIDDILTQDSFVEKALKFYIQKEGWKE